MSHSSPTGYRNPHDPSDPEPWGPAESLPPRPPLAPTAQAVPERRTPGPGRKAAWLVPVGTAVFLGAWFGSGMLRSDVTTEIPVPVEDVQVTAATTAVSVHYADVPTARIVELNKPRGSQLEHRVVDGELIVEHRTRSGITFGPSWGQELEIVLPTASARDTPDVVVRTSTGSIAVDGGFGATDMTATTGSVRAAGSFEAVRAKVTTGSIEIDGTAPSVAAEATTGSVDVRVTAAQDVDAKATTGSVDVTVDGPQPNRVTARTTTGGIDLRLPGGSYQVEAKTTTGSVDVGVPEDPASPHRVQAEASTGSVRVR
ncbi:MAG: DUF4097 family beta strand repeat-containing protein [Propionibacteriaceae bacterium]|nr:DUF4097 family beta strand repeat-containing protein [Propionibacteriaceae bacterium]